MIALLLWALYPHNPYGYYTFLRIFCFAGFGYLAWLAIKDKSLKWSTPFIIAAILYNPIIKVYLTRDVWSVINILTALLLAASLFLFKPKPVKHGDQESV
jgi:hypothetical protein